MSEEALRDAICDGNFMVMQKLVEDEGVSINYIDADDGWPLLLWAVKAHQPDCLRYLLEKGANIHVGDASGNTALHKAAYLGHVDCVKLLVEYGARINARNLMQQTPQDLAEIFDRKEILDVLSQLQTRPEGNV